tara:strand:- start:2929 stop:4017 length:1089 start_codon:yes stop_codon:yes gene_type:complete
MKKILFYLGHPAHAHNFVYISKILKEHGHAVFFAVRQREILVDLVQDFEYDHVIIYDERKRNSVFSVIKSLLKREYEMFKIIKWFKPDLMVGTDIVITHLGKFFNIPSIILCDDDSSVVPLMANLGFRFASSVLAPDICNITPFNFKKIGYRGLQKLSYLHPNYFSPDKSLINNGFDFKERYFMIRFVSLSAHHDNNVRGIDDKLLDSIIQLLIPYGKVYISSERTIPEKYHKLILSIKPNLIHQAMYYSDLFISDSQSMTIECCILGTPSIRYNDFVGRISVLEELQYKYKLTFGISPDKPDELLNKIEELAKFPNIKKEWKKRKEKMLKNMIDVTSFITNVIENFPSKIKQSEEINKNSK